MPDLGVKRPTEGPCCAPVSPKQKNKKDYPCMTLRDEQVERVKGENSCEVDELYTAVVKLRVAGINHDNYGKRLEFEVQSMDNFVPAGKAVDEDVDEPKDEEAEAEKKTVGYDRKALVKSRSATKTPAPGGDGKDLSS